MKTAALFLCPKCGLIITINSKEVLYAKRIDENIVARKRDAPPVVQYTSRSAKVDESTDEPGYGETGNAGGASRDIPDGIDSAGGKHRTLYRYSRRNIEYISVMEAVAADSREKAGGTSRHAGENLL